jgi:hypothetical protein
LTTAAIRLLLPSLARLLGCCRDRDLQIVLDAESAARHRPEELIEAPMQYLSIIMYQRRE